MYALIIEGRVWELFSANPHLSEDSDVRDVSSWPEIKAGWVVEANGFAPPAAAPPAPPAGPVVTFKADIYRRCTDEEAEAIEMALAAAPVRQRRLFESAQFLEHTAPEFATMREAIAGMFGGARADELLAAS